ncbi:MAG: ABC transporter permease [Bacteroidota bacterium]
MNIILTILRKEFLQIFRNKAMLPIIFVMPLIQLLLLTFAATFELNQVEMAVVDHNKSAFSRSMIDHLTASEYFVLSQPAANEAEGKELLQKGEASFLLVIPSDVEEQVAERGVGQVQLVIDAVRGNTAGLIQAYASSILQRFNLRVQQDDQPKVEAAGLALTHRYWYNNDLAYDIYMVPGILVVLVTMIGVFLSGMNVVREREIGTIEQLNVTPIKKYQFILGKLLPFWIIGLGELTFGLIVAKVVFDLPMVGSLWVIGVVAAIYLVTVQGLGLYVSTITNTQQQAMFISWFLMVVFILMGGLFTPIESMPEWAQMLTWGNPVAYFIQIMRMVLLKGAGAVHIWPLVLALIGMGMVILTFAIRSYRKVA